MNLGVGYVDFAGSGVVHAMGGVAALAGAIVLGPRIGKFGKDGKPRALPGHHIPMAMLGTFILLFGWFGFNAASTFAATDVQFAVVAANTAIAAAFGAIIAMFWIMLRTGKPDPGMMANGMLAGLVAITAPCAFVQPWAAAVIGIIAGVLVIESVFFIERKLKIDDPVGAISVHGVCGIFGVLCRRPLRQRPVRRRLERHRPTATRASPASSTAAPAGASSAPRPSARSAIWTVMFGIAFAFFKIQNALTKGGIRADGGRRARRPRPARDGRARLPGVPPVRGRGDRDGLVTQGRTGHQQSPSDEGSRSHRLPSPTVLHAECGRPSGERRGGTGLACQACAG